MAGMKIDYVKKDDEHKCLIRMHDDGQQVVLVSIATDGDGISIVAVDANYKDKIRFAAHNTLLVVDCLGT